MADESQIASFYASKKVLVTGATGFMGKVLLWKLLHSCPLLDVIFVLIRPKYGKPAMSRKEDFFSSQIFDNFKKDNPEILNKVVFIAGDVGEEGIGLSDADRNLIINEVSIIFHNAAILKMDASLSAAVNVNITGTARILNLAMKMEKLEAFVYNSTAFCCCDNPITEEKIYPAKHNPQDIIRLTQWMNPEILEKITPQLVDPLRNTYIYSKRLTECLLSEYESKVPIIVARPSIVVSAYKEPLPGWNDSLNGPSAFFVIGGKGILRTTMMNKDGKCNIIPVDMAINAIIALPWANSKKELMKEIKVCNISQTAYEDLTWGKLVHMAIKSFDKYPYERFLWYPTSDPFTNNILVYTLKCIFLHYLPAYIIDFIMVLIGEKRFMVRAHNKLRLADKIVRYFSYQRWVFKNDGILGLEKQMNNTDRKRFMVNMQHMGVFQDQMDNTVYASKVYLFKEDMKNIHRAKRLAKIMYVVDKLSYLLKLYLLWKILTFLYSMFLKVVELYQ